MLHDDMLKNENLLGFIPNGQNLNMTEVPYFWNVNGIFQDDTRTFVSGWALPFGGNLDVTNILVNGKVCGTVHFSENEDVARLYPWWPNARMSEFLLTIDKTEFDFATEEEVILEASPKRETTSTHSKHALHLSMKDLSSVFPDDVVRSRIGSTDTFQFSMTGLTLARQFQRVFETATGRKWHENNSILDWGCGSGRVARHMVQGLDKGQNFIGLDIDGPAIKWASKHIAPMFQQSGMNPPLPLDASSVDVAYAYSVFTHLTLPHIRTWVGEMARAIKKDGHFMFTILSKTAIVALLPYAGKDVVQKFHSIEGFDTIQNSQLETIDVSGDYYRNVWYSLEILKNEMKDLFEVTYFEEGFHYYQDIVVCKRL